jgi:hypothetical protein
MNDSKNGFRHHTFVDLDDALLASKSGQFWVGDMVSINGFAYRVGPNLELEFIPQYSNGDGVIQ